QSSTRLQPCVVVSCKLAFDRWLAARASLDADTADAFTKGYSLSLEVNAGEGGDERGSWGFRRRATPWIDSAPDSSRARRRRHLAGKSGGRPAGSWPPGRRAARASPRRRRAVGLRHALGRWFPDHCPD